MKYKIMRMICMFDLPVMPEKGNVRIIVITEKQYDDMKIFVGSKSETEKSIGAERMIII